MDYKFFRTDQIDEVTLNSYVRAFNEIFEKDFSKDFFKNKYQNVAQGYSYHSFMIDEGKVVGACTFVPYKYNYFGKNLTFGLGVDVFVLPEYRSNPMALYQMYGQVREAMEEDKVAFSFAIPNVKAYPFWTKILKWKDIGDLTYYVLPVRFGKVLKKTTFFDGITAFLVKILVILVRIFSTFFNTSSKKKSIEINRNQKKLLQHRFFDKYIQSENFAYKIYDEDGIKTAYLIDFQAKNAKNLAKVVANIVFNQKVDLIIFVGEIDFFQLSLIKLPKNKEPKRLPFIGEILDETVVNEDIFKAENWEMGLFNYDVR